MKAIRCDEPGHLSMIQLDEPEESVERTILKINRIGVCGTDLHAFEGTQPYFSYPRILGHELSGTIVSNSNAGFERDEMVTIIPYFHCGHCKTCKRGLTNCCSNIRVCGVHVDGGMREYLSVPTDALIHGRGLTFEQLALVEPLAISTHGVHRAGVQPEDNVLVLGAGPIGVGALEMARIKGGNVTILDVNEDRLVFCRQQLGINHTINPTQGNALEMALEITNGEGFDTVLDATGNLKAINDGFSYLAHGGRYVIIGLQKEKISFSHPDFHKREGTLMSSRNAYKEDFEFVIDCVKANKLNPLNMITHRVPFDEVVGQFGSWLNPATGVIKAMIEID